MSKRNRKISYWSINFSNGEELEFSPDVFQSFISYLDQLEEIDKIYRDERTSKAFSIESINDYISHQKKQYKIVLKSCKYNHSPKYMSSINGSERDSEKALSEGEKEITHLLIRVDENEAFAILEDRTSGVSMSALCKYLNGHFKNFIHNNHLDESKLIVPMIVPSEDFITALNASERITNVELFVENQVLGTGFLCDFLPSSNIQEEITVKIKAKRKQSVKKEALTQLYNKLFTAGNHVKRIRVKAKDANNLDVSLDTFCGKKVDEITVDLLDNGIVDSNSVFNELNNLMEAHFDGTQR